MSTTKMIYTNKKSELFNSGSFFPQKAPCKNKIDKCLFQNLDPLLK